MNNPPFAIGQKVVCIDDSPHRNLNIKGLVKENIYTVRDFGPLGLAIGLVGDPPERFWFMVRFAPIQTNYSDATAEILEKFKSPNETPDKTIVPEKVFN